MTSRRNTTESLSLMNQAAASAHQDGYQVAVLAVRQEDQGSKFTFKYEGVEGKPCKLLEQLFRELIASSGGTHSHCHSSEPDYNVSSKKCVYPNIMGCESDDTSRLKLLLDVASLIDNNRATISDTHLGPVSPECPQSNDEQNVAQSDLKSLDEQFELFDQDNVVSPSYKFGNADVDITEASLFRDERAGHEEVSDRTTSKSMQELCSDDNNLNRISARSRLQDEIKLEPGDMELSLPVEDFTSEQSNNRNTTPDLSGDRVSNKDPGFSDICERIGRIEVLVDPGFLQSTTRHRTREERAPVRSVQELEKLDKSLRSHVTEKEEMIAYLVTIGGDTVSKAVKRLLMKIATNSVWSSFSLYGRKGKRAFADTMLYTCVIRACKIIHPGATETELDLALQIALRSAPHQTGGPKFRRKSKQKMNEIGESTDICQRIGRIEALVENLAGSSQSNDRHGTIKEKLPVKSVQECEKLDISLRKHVDEKNDMISYLVTIGGDTVSKAVKRLLMRIATNGVWSAYSLYGRKGKRSFADTTVYKCVMGACRTIHHGATETEVDLAIQSALRSAPQQTGGTKFRRKTNQNKNVTYESNEMETEPDTPS